MKILIDARMYGLENSGIGRYLINLIEQLEDVDTADELTLLLRKKYYESLTLPKKWNKVLVDIPHYSIREQLFLPSFIKRANPDIVHFPHLNVPIFYRGKYVMTVHDLTMQKQGMDATKLSLPLYYFKRVPFLYISNFAVKNAMKIIVPSKTTAVDLANYYNLSVDKIEITYEGYNIKNISDARDTGEISVLSKYNLVGTEYFFYVGNAYPHKNFKKVIEAVKDLNEAKKVRVKFVIAGQNNGFRESLQNFANDISATDYVDFVGYVKDEELQVLYKNSLSFFYASLSEGFGLQGLEAISSGTALVCSNIPVFKEIYEFHAYYFDPRDTLSISGTLFSVVNLKKEEKNRYVRSAQSFIKKYSWRKMAEDTLKVYKTCFKTHPAGSF